MSTMTRPDLGPFPEVAGYDEALRLDAADALAGYRAHYVHTDPELVYLDGNSLGRLPAAAVAIAAEVTKDQWGDRLIRSWNEGWWDLQLRLGDLLASMVGARPGEVMISDSTSVNLYKLAHAAVASMPEGRDVIVTDDLNFPSDIYVLQSVADQTGRSLQIVPSDGIHGPVDALATTIGERTALVSVSHTVFQSGYTYDLARVTRLAQDAGAMMLWDCSHSVGAIPIDFAAAGVDLAVGCTYKHLNGGPGSPAFLYVRQDLQERLTNPIAGWWGHEVPFALELDFRPTEGIRRFHVGTMPILSLAVIEAGLADVAAATVEAIRAKSVAMGAYVIDQFHEHLIPLGFQLASPSDPERRGSHVSLRHEHAWPIDVALIKRSKVIPDFRAPDTLRLGLAPLYNSFLEVHTAVQRIARVVTTGAYKEFAGYASKVT
jgi:kynureninase